MRYLPILRMFQTPTVPNPARWSFATPHPTCIAANCIFFCSRFITCVASEPALPMEGRFRARHFPIRRCSDLWTLVYITGQWSGIVPFPRGGTHASCHVDTWLVRKVMSFVALKLAFALPGVATTMILTIASHTSAWTGYNVAHSRES